MPLKIRYDTKIRLLSGWTDNEAEFNRLQARKGERIVELSITKPDADDYEDFIFSRGKLISSGKQQPEPPRDLLAEIDELKARLNKAGVA